jgi:hypothetical protein
MHPEIHPTITIQSYPGHHTRGSYFITVQQAEEQPDSHRVGGVGRAKTISPARISAHQMQRIERGFVGGSEPAYQGFDDSRGRKIRESHRNAEADKNQQNLLP